MLHRPNSGALPRCDSVGHLGGPLTGRHLRVHLPRDAKVPDADYAVLCEQDVPRLDIAMQHAGGGAGLESLQDLRWLAARSAEAAEEMERTPMRPACRAMDLMAASDSRLGDLRTTEARSTWQSSKTKSVLQRPSSTSNSRSTFS